jgi:hypothetical protein
MNNKKNDNLVNAKNINNYTKTPEEKEEEEQFKKRKELMNNKNNQVGGLKKLYIEKKKIENRINNSIHEFLYIKPNINFVKSKTKSKTKSNNRFKKIHKTKRFKN